LFFTFLGVFPKGSLLTSFFNPELNGSLLFVANGSLLFVANGSFTFLFLFIA